MSASLATTIAAYGAAVGAWAALSALRGREVSRGQAVSVAIIEVAALGQAAAAIAGLFRGHEVSEKVVLIAYLIASVAILPIVWPLASDDSSRWGAATLALGCVAVAVIAVRALDVWQG